MPSTTLPHTSDKPQQTHRTAARSTRTAYRDQSPYLRWKVERLNPSARAAATELAPSAFACRKTATRSVSTSAWASFRSFSRTANKCRSRPSWLFARGLRGSLAAAWATARVAGFPDRDPFDTPPGYPTNGTLNHAQRAKIFAELYGID